MESVLTRHTSMSHLFDGRCYAVRVMGAAVASFPASMVRSLTVGGRQDSRREEVEAFSDGRGARLAEMNERARDGFGVQIERGVEGGVAGRGDGVGVWWRQLLDVAR
jgi:hypothetical protein